MLVSFLQPLIAEVNQLYRRGLIIKRDSVEKFNGKVAILGFTGDIPGIAEIMHFGGHTGTYGCRICDVRADSYRQNITHGKYFSGVGDDRTAESLIEGDIVRHITPQLYNSFTNSYQRNMECVVYLI